MQKSKIIYLISFLFLYDLSINGALSKDIANQSIIEQLERGLNNKDHESLKSIFQQKSFADFERDYLSYTKDYKESKWEIKTIDHERNKQYLEVKITSSRDIAGEKYNLNSEQILELQTYKNTIKSYKIINDKSILKSDNNPLIVSINAPDQVLTGERYEINLIIEKPIENYLIASGMITLTNKDSIKVSQQYFDIKPNNSGGLFKYVKAPLSPGSQTISAIITHPKGIYSFTKKINVGLTKQPIHHP